jgi:wyosine [tRNA(Phe)-imidazoG37] synthetase (radical SAM superfamily)
MKKEDFKYIYGPVPSWRLGASLGIDLLSSEKKICSFDCIYCQLGSVDYLIKQPQLYVETSEVIAELKRLPKVNIDYITFSGRGEPSLARNLAEAIQAVKKLNIAPVAVLTNASLIERADIRASLSLADFVVAKLDACSQESLEKVNRPAKAIRLEDIVRGIKQFKKEFKGKLALQIMFLEANQPDAPELAKLAREIGPDEVQINTPLRPCAVKALSKQEIDRIKKQFSGMNAISVYDIQPKSVRPLSKKETLTRRGKIK